MSMPIRDRHTDRERAPRALSQRVDDGDAESGQCHDEDEKNGKGTNSSRQWSDLGACDVCQRLAAASGRRPEAHRIVNRAAQRAPRHEPERPGANPNCAASTGPTSGPAPAIAAKWCPKRTHRLIGWKFDPSYFECAGVTAASSSAMTFAAMKAL
jgi:hypothetical protein